MALMKVSDVYPVGKTIKHKETEFTVMSCCNPCLTFIAKNSAGDAFRFKLDRYFSITMYRPDKGNSK